MLRTDIDYETGDGRQSWPFVLALAAFTWSGAAGLLWGIFAAARTLGGHW
jgi:hypothetical protein